MNDGAVHLGVIGPGLPPEQEVALRRREVRALRQMLAGTVGMLRFGTPEMRRVAADSIEEALKIGQAQNDEA